MGDRESQVEQRITKLNSQVRNLEQSRHSARSEHEDARQEMKNTGAEIVRLRADLVNKNRLLEKTKKERSDAETGVGHLTDELNSDFSTKLSSSEQKELKRLNTELPQMKEKLVKLGSARSSAESKHPTRRCWHAGQCGMLGGIAVLPCCSFHLDLVWCGLCMGLCSGRTYLRVSEL